MSADPYADADAARGAWGSNEDSLDFFLTKNEPRILLRFVAVSMHITGWSPITEDFSFDITGSGTDVLNMLEYGGFWCHPELSPLTETRVSTHYHNFGISIELNSRFHYKHGLSIAILFIRSWSRVYTYKLISSVLILLPKQLIFSHDAE